MTLNTPTFYLGLADYAAHVGKSERTVARWLNDPSWELPGATFSAGVWQIPADAQPIRRPTADVVQLRQEPAQLEQPAAPAQQATLAQQLDDEPAFLDLEAASVHLGIPETQIRRNRDMFELVALGPQGSLVMPQRVIRRLRGDA